MGTLDGLDDIDWARHHHAFGDATDVPRLLRRLVEPGPTSRQEALGELWGTVWHQGTVYDCTPLVVPFLVGILDGDDVDTDTRAELTILLASIAAALSFVDESESPRLWPASWQRGPGQAEPRRDLVERCRDAVADHVTFLTRVFGDAPRPVRVGLLAVFAAIADRLPEDLVLSVEELGRQDEPRVASSARLVVLLAGNAQVTVEEVWALAAADADVLDLLGCIDDWPVRVQAVETARELSISAIANA